MVPLPACRMQPGLPAFSRSFEVTILWRKVKRWGCLFTCLTTRVVHLEMAYTLDTDAFLSALLRFEQQRGTPAAYYGDNGQTSPGPKPN